MPSEPVAGPAPAGRSRRWTRLGAALLGLLVLGVAGLAVAAELRPARLVAASPPAGARLSAAPDLVTLTFSDRLDPGQTHVWVSRAGEGFAAAGAPRVRDNRVQLPVVLDGDGDYRVGYHVRLATGRTVAGTVPFTLAPEVRKGPFITVSAGEGALPIATAGSAPPEGAAAGHHGGGGPGDLVLLLLPVATGAVLLVLLARRRAAPTGPPTAARPARPRRAWVLREPETDPATAGAPQRTPDDRSTEQEERCPQPPTPPPSGPSSDGPGTPSATAGPANGRPSSAAERR